MIRPIHSGVRYDVEPRTLHWSPNMTDWRHPGIQNPIRESLGSLRISRCATMLWLLLAIGCSSATTTHTTGQLTHDFRVEVTPLWIRVNGNEIVPLSCRFGDRACTPANLSEVDACEADPSGPICDEALTISVPPEYKMDGDEDSLVIVPLCKEVKRTLHEIAESSLSYHPTLTIVADWRVPFRLLTEVLHTITSHCSDSFGDRVRFRRLKMGVETDLP